MVEQLLATPIEELQKEAERIAEEVRQQLYSDPDGLFKWN